MGWTTLSEEGTCALSGRNLQALDVTSEAFRMSFWWIWMFPKTRGGWAPQIMNFNRVWNHCKPSILGAHLYFWFNTRLGRHFEKNADGKFPTGYFFWD